jgi:hypothetical protein
MKNIMGLFDKKIELTEQDFNKLNNLLPQNLQKEVWSEKEIINGGLYESYSSMIQANLTEVVRLKEKIKKDKENSLNKIASKILVFNSEPNNVELLGMVDIGLVERFGAVSTGNRFENNFVGYAIEGAFDKVWAENNAQFDAVQKVKLELLKKTLALYSKSNCLYKFEIDFREIGTSGNVFIYARGTACIGENTLLKQTQEKFEVEIKELEQSLLRKRDSIKLLEKNRYFIPSNSSELRNFIEGS